MNTNQPLLNYNSHLPTSATQAASEITVACEKVCQCFSDPASTAPQLAGSRRSKLTKTAAMYATMVVVSTCAIFLLEHATLYSAFRTALVAAIGKTLAANWVSTIFE